MIAYQSVTVTKSNPTTSNSAHPHVMSLGRHQRAACVGAMDEALLKVLNARAEQEHVSRSEAIREAVRAWTRVA